MLAPGTMLRSGLESILNANKGALVVVGDNDEIMGLVEGGFNINCQFTDSALYELAKMDGAIILDGKVEKILRANAHLHPLVTIPSNETGIRHRIAQRVARQTDALVVAISEHRGTISFYKGLLKYVLRDTGFILTKANQAVQTLDKYRYILNRTLDELSALEIKGISTVNDAAEAIQQAVLVLHIIEELEIYICQLGSEGKLVNIQLQEINWDLKKEILLLIRDYYQPGKTLPYPRDILNHIQSSPRFEPLDLREISRILGYGYSEEALRVLAYPKGYRVMSKIAPIPVTVVDDLVNTFGSLNNLMASNVEGLTKVEGIGEARAQTIKEGFLKFHRDILDQGSE
ncbi:MAG: DNA integrity scanning protein DisA [Clostridia bacterium]|nr:DNA integrity scanning protein DisA [Clostridia bacterium]